MKKALFISFLLASSLFGMEQIPQPFSFSQGREDASLTIHNTILAKVNGNTISVLDIMKKMDMIFHRSYPHLIDSKPARYQFYQTSWQQVLNEMVNTELILADAKDKDLKIHDGEIREEMETRFGPKVLFTLDKIGVTYDEAWKMVKNDMIVQRMNWFFVHSRALQKVTPQAIRQAYREHCLQNPSSNEWNYQVITIRSDQQQTGKELALKTYELLTQKTERMPLNTEELSSLSKDFKNCSIQLSSEYSAQAKDLAESHLSTLETLDANTFSKPVLQTSRFDSKAIHRIFYLKNHEKESPPSFEDLSIQLKEELMQKVSMDENALYLEKLRKHYSHGQPLLEKLPENFQPFVLTNTLVK